MAPITLRQFMRLAPCVVVLIACAREGSAVAKGRGGDLWREHDGNDPPVATTPITTLPSLAPLVKQLSPAVVNIYTTQVIKPGSREFNQGFGEQDPMEQFWHRFMAPQQEMKRSSLGSGFIINPKGLVITNNHVVDKATEIKVKLADGREFPGEVVGRDAKTDIALVKVKSPTPFKDLPSVYLGDSDKLEVGDFVIAIGNPFGLDHSVSLGIVSAKERAITNSPYDDFIQTDAAINPGNSGGPLFNLKGEVVGVNTAILNGAQGLGFAAPINLAKEVLPSLEAKGSVSRGWLGVGVQEVTPELAKGFNLERPSGALIREVFNDSPAEKAGLKAGDVVVSVNGRDVVSFNQLARYVAVVSPGQTANLGVLRDGKQVKIGVKVTERPQDEELTSMRSNEPPPGSPGRASGASADRLGIAVHELNAELARRFEISSSKGLVVVDVNADSPAAAAGVAPGSLILEVNRSPVRTVSDYQKAVSNVRPGDLVLLRLQRDNAAVYVAVRMPA